MEPIGPHDALIVVDVQNDFCAGGALAVPGAEDIIDKVNRLLPRFQHVLATKDWHPSNHASFQAQGGPWPPHCMQDTPGAEFHPGLDSPLIETVIHKGAAPDLPGYSGFEQTDLAAELNKRDVQRIFVCGLATDYCVRATTLAALDEGLQAVVVTDAVSAVADGSAALEEMRTAGAELASTTDIP